jgi:hypothetical protein
MNIQMELLDNYASIRAAFVNKFLPASYMDAANESACSRFMWDYMPKSDYPSVSFAVDDEVRVSVNGKYFSDTYRDHRVIFKKDIRKLLKKGNNVIRFEVTNYSGPTGLVYDLMLDEKIISSGENSFFSLDGGKNWKNAHAFGSQPVAPWGKPRLMIFDL